MDLELAAFAKGKKNFDYRNPIPKKRRAFYNGYKNGNLQLSLFVKKLRHNNWRTVENHNKQVQVLLDRERFQQHKSWQMEHDRIRSHEYGTWEGDIPRTNDLGNRALDLYNFLSLLKNPASNAPA